MLFYKRCIVVVVEFDLQVDNMDPIARYKHHVEAEILSDLQSYLQLSRTRKVLEKKSM